jgi:uncharacterized protein YbjT (DUF2867 family)
MRRLTLSRPRRPLAAVFGATGRQGGGVARALLAHGGWRVRALTRRPDSAAAKALVHQGAEIHPADLDDPASLRPALAGAQAVFAVTNFWDHHDAEHELRQAGRIAEAAAASPALEHLVWSTLEDSRALRPPRAGQRWSVPHMDAKAEANARFLELGLPVTLLLTSFYWDNLITHGMGPQRAGDGVLELALPLGEMALPGIAAQDIGPCVAALLATGRAAGAGAIGPMAQRRIGIAGEHLCGPAMAARLAQALGEPVRWRDVPLAEYAALPFAGAAELAAMFAWKQQAHAQHGALAAARPLAATRALHPGLLDFAAWSRRHAALLMPQDTRALPLEA